MKKLIDFHCHSPLSQYSDNQDIFSLYCHADVTKNLPDQLGDGPFTAGLHPWFVPDNPQELEKVWQKLLEFLELSNCISLGECGLDRLKGPSLDIQKDIFKMQLELAKAKSLPFVVIHCVRAYPECISLIKDSGYIGYLVFHDFGSKKEVAKQVLTLEKSFFSIGQALERSAFVEQSLPHLPLDRLILETDDKESLSINDRYRQLSQALNRPLEEISTTLHKNAQVILPPGVL